MNLLPNLKLRRIVIMIAFALSIAATSFAQPSDEEENLGDADGDTAVPIDGGLTLALAAGAGYLVKRRHDARKKKAQQNK